MSRSSLRIITRRTELHKPAARPSSAALRQLNVLWDVNARNDIDCTDNARSREPYARPGRDSLLNEDNHHPLSLIQQSLRLVYIDFFHDDAGSRKTQWWGRCTGWAKKLDHFKKCITFSYNNIGRRSIYQNVQLFIRSKMMFWMPQHLNILCIR